MNKYEQDSNNPYKMPSAPVANYRTNNPVSDASNYNLLPLRGVFTFVCVSTILFSLARTGVAAVDSMIPGDGLTEEDAEFLLPLIFGTAGFSILCMVISAVAVCVFMYRSNANARAMGATGMTHTPGWCGGYWFIPILNLFRPYTAMLEIAKVSQNPRDPHWEQFSTGGVVGFWWASWIGANLLGRVLSVVAESNMEAATIIGWVTTLLLWVSLVFLLTITKRITDLQESWLSTK